MSGQHWYFDSAGGMLFQTRVETRLNPSVVVKWSEDTFFIIFNGHHNKSSRKPFFTIISKCINITTFLRIPSSTVTWKIAPTPLLDGAFCSRKELECRTTFIFGLKSRKKRPLFVKHAHCAVYTLSSALKTKEEGAASLQGFYMKNANVMIIKWKLFDSIFSEWFLKL